MAMKRAELPALVPQVYEHEQFGKIRVIGDAENPRFCLSDACKMLGIGNPSDVKKRLDKGVVSIETLQTAGGMQKITFVNEDGLYDLILESRKPEARKMRKWITAEVVPSIRKHGVYMTVEAAEKILFNPDFIIGLAKQVKDAQAERDAALAQVAELKPKADYCERILQSTEALPVTVIAKDYGMNAVDFNRLLHKLEIQYKVGKTWVLRQIYAGLGYMKTVTTELKGGLTVTMSYWTQKGRMFLYNVLKKANILPLIERNNPQVSLF